MGLVAGRDLQGRRLDLGEAACLEPSAQRGFDPAARQQKQPPIGMPMGRPPGRRSYHRAELPESLALGSKISMLRADIPAIEDTPLRVIASSLRKGNIVDLDGKLYVVVSAENIHPGKGT